MAVGALTLSAVRVPHFVTQTLSRSINRGDIEQNEHFRVSCVRCGVLFALKNVSHPQVGENRTALFPVLVLFWCVGGRGVIRVTYSMSKRDG